MTLNFVLNSKDCCPSLIRKSYASKLSIYLYTNPVKNVLCSNYLSIGKLVKLF